MTPFVFAHHMVLVELAKGNLWLILGTGSTLEFVLGLKSVCPISYNNVNIPAC